MRAHYLQHVFFEGPAYIESSLRDQGWAITSTRLFESAKLPPITDIDFLIILGGPMSVNDESTFPWLVSEKSWIHEFIETGKPTLGICLGAQLIASAMGARIYQNPEPEIGWFPITGTPFSHPSIFQFPETLEVFHWHGETFDLPPGAVHLASSKACENQAFQLGKSVIGLQFHLETTPDSAQALVTHCAADLQPSHFVQDAESLLAAPSEYFERIHQQMIELLAYLTQGT